MEEKITLAGKEYVCAQIAMQALLYTTMQQLEKRIAEGMPSITFRGQPYLCIEDCHKWHAGEYCLEENR